MKRDLSLKDRKEKEPLKGFEPGKACSELCFGMALVLKGVEWNSMGKRFEVGSQLEAIL
jgi:hypothetical protein